MPQINEDEEDQVTMLWTVVNLIAVLAVMALGYWGMIKVGAWYLDTEEQQVRDGVKDPRTATLPVLDKQG